MNTYLTIGLLTVFMSVLAPIIGGFGASVNAQEEAPTITWEYRFGGDKENFELSTNDVANVTSVFTSIQVANLGESPEAGTTGLGEEQGTQTVNIIRNQMEDTVNTINNALTTLSSQAGTTAIGQGPTAKEWSVCVWVVCGHF